jgi:hypothetical protein
MTSEPHWRDLTIRDSRRQGQRRFFREWVTGKGILDEDQWAWEKLFTFVSLAQIRPVNLLLSNYGTMGAVRHGDYVAKIRIAPVPELAGTVARAAVRALDGGRYAARAPYLARRRISVAIPSAECSIVNSAAILPPASITHTACVSAARSIPVKNSGSGSARDAVTPQDGSEGGCSRWSLTGALRRVPLLPVCSPGRTGGGSVMPALHGRPNQAVAPAPAEPQQQAPYRCLRERWCPSDRTAALRRRQAGYPARNYPKRMMRPVPGAVTLSLSLNTTPPLLVWVAVGAVAGGVIGEFGGYRVGPDISGHSDS